MRDRRAIERRIAILRERERRADEFSRSLPLCSKITDDEREKLDRHCMVTAMGSAVEIHLLLGQWKRAPESAEYEYDDPQAVTRYAPLLRERVERVRAAQTRAELEETFTAFSEVTATVEAALERWEPSFLKGKN